MDTIESLKAERDKAEAALQAERVGRCFEGSQLIRDRFTVPPDMMLATFGKHFSIEDGRAVAKDAEGKPIMSRERPGEPADFDEALATLVTQSGYAERITLRPGGNGKPNGTQPPMSREAYNKLPLLEQGRWVRGGGRVEGAVPPPGISREAFAAMTHDAQQEFLRGGGRLGW